MLKTNIGPVFKVFLNPPTRGKKIKISHNTWLIEPLVTTTTFLRIGISRCCPLNCFFRAFDRLGILGFRQCAPNQRESEEQGICVQCKCSLYQSPTLCGTVTSIPFLLLPQKPPNSFPSRETGSLAHCSIVGL